MAITTIKPGGGGDYTTIADWYSAASDGDTGVLYTGVYNETLDVAKANLTLSIAAGETVSIEPASSTYVIQLSAGSGGFTITGESRANPLTLRSVSNSQPVIKFVADVAASINYCRFRGVPSGNQGWIYSTTTNAAAVRVTGCSEYAASVATNFVRGALWGDLQLYDCVSDLGGTFVQTNAFAGRIDRCATKGYCVLAPIAATMSTAGAVTLANGRHLGIGAGVTSLPIWAPGHAFKVDNYHFRAGDADALASGTGIGLVGSGTNLQVRNTKILGYHVGITADSAFQPTYCDIWSNTTDYDGSASAGAGCISADPLEIGGGDYHHDGASPCINAGTDTGATPDLDGISRPQGAAYDIGEYEALAPPRVGTLTSIDPWHSKVIFVKADGTTPQTMTEDAAFWDVASYPDPLASSDGGVSASIYTAAGADYSGGFPTSAILTHHKVTAGKTYAVNVTGALTSTDAESLDPAHLTASMTASADPATLLSASAPTRLTVAVTFSEVMHGGSISVPSAWTVSAIDGSSDVVSVTGVSLFGSVATLTLDSPMTAGGRYQVIAPANIMDEGNNVIDPTARTAYFVVPWSDLEIAPVEGFLASLAASAAEELGNLKGAPTTRLREPLAPSDTDILVESTLGFPGDTFVGGTGGVVWIDGEQIPYAYRRTDAFVGCTRETVIDPDDSVAKPFRFNTLPPGTEVRDGSMSISLTDQARRDTRLSTCPDEMLDFLTADRGYPRPFVGVTDDDLREYAMTRWYLDAGTWWAAYRACCPMLRWGELTGTDGVVVDGNTLSSATLPLGEYHARWVIVSGKLHRVRQSMAVAGVQRLVLEDFDGPFFEAAALTGGAFLEWTMLPFRWVTDYRNSKAGAIDVYIYLPGSGLPFTYIMGTPDPTPADGRPFGGQAMLDHTQAGTDYHPLFVLNPYENEVKALVGELVPAATLVRCRWLSSASVP